MTKAADLAGPDGHITVTIEFMRDGFDANFMPNDGRGWEYRQYRFVYRNRLNDQRIQMSWRCGTLYGEPKPHDGLESAFVDAHTVEYEAFGQGWADGLGYENLRAAERVYKACERMDKRLDTFFATPEQRAAWDEYLNER